MGAASSKVSSELNPHKSVQSPVLNEKAAMLERDDLSSDLTNLNISSDSAIINSRISSKNLEDWEKDVTSDSKNILAQNAFSNNSIVSVIGVNNYDTRRNDRFLFNIEVDKIGTPDYFDNQRSSGRCWIFATCNVLRSHVIRSFNLKEDGFQLSQSYLFFYDKLERANLFLENALETAHEELESRLVSFLFDSPVGDGGQWDMIINLITKYGLVPYEFFPDRFQSQNSSALNYVITEKLREFALHLRKLKNENASSAKIDAVKSSMMKQIYSIVALALGTPPKPDDSITWETKDKSGKFIRIKTTPLEFYNKFVKYDVTKRFSLISDPRNEYGKLYTVDKLNNVYGGKPIEYVNTEISSLKETAIRMLRDNEPVFFGCDVGKFSNSGSGILDTNAFDYNSGFGTALNISKAERLRTGSSQMTHAMVIVGVHLDEFGNPTRWKIENSWGPDSGEHGFYMMTDSWFNEYVFQIVSAKKYVDPSLYSVWKTKEFNMLPFFDPMGALA